MICLCLPSPTLEEALQCAERYRGRVDMVELRGDFLEVHRRDELRAFPARLPVPLRSIYTIRRKEDGGNWTQGEKLRRRYLLDALEDGSFDWVDVEEDWWIKEAQPKWKAKVLCSLHDFRGIPGDLEERVYAMAECAEHIKVAVAVDTTKDVLRFLETLERLDNATPNKVFVAMGEYGLFSRVLSDYLGVAWSYAVCEGTMLAPGQLSVEALHEVYRVREINRDTKIFAVIGDPLSHSKSPQYHNDAFERARLNACYVPMRSDDVDSFFEVADKLALRGFSVTVPHKEAVFPHVDASDDTLRATGACNTVYLQEGAWRGVNTDVEGFMKPLRDVRLVSSAKALVIGAGGAARAVVYALLRSSHRVHIVNRSSSRAEALAKTLREHGDLSVVDAARASATRYDLIVQTTPVGMAPLDGEDPLPSCSFGGDEIVYDIIYNPAETCFLRRAKRAGCTVISGLEMFEAQAAAQARYFARSLR